MIISHKHKFIFIKTHKTAGTSLEIALSQFCGPDDVITPITKEDEAYRKKLGYRGVQNRFFPGEQPSIWKRIFKRKETKKTGFYNHMSAAEIRQRISPEIWDTYYKFCFERNPYDKFLSWYHWTGGDKRFGGYKAFIEAGVAASVKGYSLYTIGDKVVVDKIYKYEEMKTALADLTARMQLETPLALPKQMTKGGVRTEKKHYSELLGDFERKWITENHRKEIELLSYSF